MKRDTYRINSKEDGNFSGSRLFNVIALGICWLSVITGIFWFIVTSNPVPMIIILGIPPFRYFFFDLTPDKLSRRPPELDRTIPLNILVHYWTIRFPIPQGGFLADVAGIFLAICRCYINGYGLLYFDTFAFLFRIRNDKRGIPLDQDITVLHDNEKLNQIAQNAKTATSEEKAEEYEELKKGWEQSEISSELNKWNFPIRRYLKASNSYFKIREVNILPIDDEYALDSKKFLKAHPDQKDYFDKKIKLDK
ncbi:hypothetical protein [Lactobacillus crispatus]|mgnify:FL=1|uniref:Uncharacterized protein n=1 Tax=Lactobacillus crispatus TaxID=47770 RepID=A0ABV2BCW3_9LACO|nr:hypothetical protein [Lactobacillus crispatus]TDM96372.1 hypothetical protein CEE88_11720 [Lactobacillus crispatus]